MASKRDKDYHFLRNSEKYLGEWNRDYWASRRGINTPENAEKIKAFDEVHSKYGFKSMVGNKRRRNTTRKSNQKNKPKARRKERAKNKRETFKIIQKETNYGNDID